MRLFWEGFEKQAVGPTAAKTLFKRLGKKKDVVIVGKRGSEGLSAFDLGMGKRLPKNEDLTSLLKHQGPVRTLLKGMSKATGKPASRLSDELRRAIRSAPIAFAGTIAKGKKGRKLYISRTGVKTVAKIQNRPFGKVLREMLHHEKFHKNVPFIGQSEILAHMYGGLKSKKGKLSPDQALKSLDMLVTARPGRFITEAALLSSPVAAAAAISGDKGNKK